MQQFVTLLCWLRMIALGALAVVLAFIGVVAAVLGVYLGQYDAVFAGFGVFMFGCVVGYLAGS